MFVSQVRMRTIVAAIALVFSVQTYAAHETVVQVKVPKQIKETIYKKNRYTPEERESERLRRVGILERSNKIFTLLAGEMALQKGNAGTALAAYMVMLNRTHDAEVAERALEMAISLNAYEQAEVIYQKWREIEPVPSEAQKRMGWVRDLVLGNQKSLKGLDEVLAHANEEQTQRIFLLLSQAAIQQPDLANRAASEVRKVAKKYPDMPEAAIADVIYSSENGNQRHTVEALQRLAKLDSEILPPTELALRLIVQKNPQILNQFFKETDTAGLSLMWQELEISNLINNKQFDKAYERLQQLLSDKPSTDLYIQAAALSAQKKEDIAVTNGYLEKAYQMGTSEQQSRTALIAAMRYVDAKDLKKAQFWVNRITDKNYLFDKAVLKASLEAEQGHIEAALTEARQAQKMPEQHGRYFSRAELQRVYLFALAQYHRPQEVLRELNALAAKVAKQTDAAERLPDILYQRAMVYADQLRQYDKAVADLRQYLKLNPNSAAGMNALGYTMLVSGKYPLEESFTLIQSAYQLEPESAAINDSMGWAYYQKGDAQAALPYLQYAYEQYPDAEVAAHLGEVLWKLGEREKAQAVFTKGLTMEGNVSLLKKTIQRLNVKATLVQ